jgi:hypothetical protein
MMTGPGDQMRRFRVGAKYLVAGADEEQSATNLDCSQ